MTMNDEMKLAFKDWLDAVALSTHFRHFRQMENGDFVLDGLRHETSTILPPDTTLEEAWRIIKELDEQRARSAGKHILRTYEKPPVSKYDLNLEDL